MTYRVGGGREGDGTGGGRGGEKMVVFIRRLLHLWHVV